MTIRAFSAFIACLAAATLAAGQAGSRPASKVPEPTSVNSGAAGSSAVAEASADSPEPWQRRSDPAGSGWQARADLVRQLSAKPQPGINYDESRVGTYTVPDPLKTKAGVVVRTASAW